MFPTAHDRSPKRSYGGLTQRVLLVTAAVTFFAAGTALAAGATPSGTPTEDAPLAQSLLTASTPEIFTTETEIKRADPVEAEEVDPAVVATEPAEPVVAPEPAVAAHGVHGACVSAVARDKSTVGRDHGAVVSKAAHSCPKAPEGVSAETDGMDKPEADQTKEAKKSAADKDRGGAEKSAAGRSHPKD